MPSTITRNLDEPIIQPFQGWLDLSLSSPEGRRQEAPTLGWSIEPHSRFRQFYPLWSTMRQPQVGNIW
jgi:hypothetical protein